ncbi:Tctex-1 [Lasiosphaeria miniovina]|uniref:Tctex-1 n=1 Tax=Lasiosphaeria miniovina TaxID=1954250 RepID=A0AA40BFH3_9PEZI|nr:Tctex-1 [Lasiosphaeria miniovina]KAK0733291.1 Tctex-1 [Lasiosphaeria miniovina]
MATQTNSPIPLKRLEQIATDACNSALANAEYYEHPKTAEWNETIIQKMLKAVLSEATPQGASASTYKFAINSTIVQHVVPTAQLNKSTGTSMSTDDEEAKAASAKKGAAGRRGMHSATGGYWNEKTDGMWSFKFDGEAKGLDVVIMLIWIAV